MSPFGPYSETLPYERTAAEIDDSVTHEVCCDQNVALCGMDVTTQEWVGDDDPTTCPMCADTKVCALCGGAC